MAPRKSFLLRLPVELLDEVNRWAADELRSVNGQIEYVLREGVRRCRQKALPPQAADQVDAPTEQSEETP